MYELELQQVPATTAAAILLGAKLEPAIPLDALGMKGCFLHALAVATFPIPVTMGRGTWQTPIPNAAPLLGVTFRNQAFVLDKGANSFGAKMSNAGDARIGCK